MSTGSQTQKEEPNPPRPWETNRALMFALLMTLVSALLGATLGLGTGIASGFGHLTSAALSGSMFGGWVGLIAGLSYGFFAKLRYLGSRSPSRTIFVFAVLGALPGALLLGVFSQGLVMMLVQGLTGLCFGASISGLAGTLVVVYFKKLL